MATAPGDITRLLRQAQDPRDHDAQQRLFLLVECELRRIAAARLRALRPGHSLCVTALIDEAFVRLIGGSRDWDGRHEFYCFASGVMRNILCDYVRRDLRRLHAAPLDPDAPGGLADGGAGDPAVLCQQREAQLALLEALGRLEKEDAKAAAVFEWRFFGGRCLELGDEDCPPEPAAKLMTIRAVADLLSLPHSTTYDLWNKAVDWLQKELKAFAPLGFAEENHA